MSKLIDEDYVLISPCARNPQFQEGSKEQIKYQVQTGILTRDLFKTVKDLNLVYAILIL